MVISKDSQRLHYIDDYIILHHLHCKIYSNLQDPLRVGGNQYGSLSAWRSVSCVNAQC